MFPRGRGSSCRAASQHGCPIANQTFLLRPLTRTISGTHAGRRSVKTFAYAHQSRVELQPRIRIAEAPPMPNLVRQAGGTIKSTGVGPWRTRKPDFVKNSNVRQLGRRTGLGTPRSLARAIRLKSTRWLLPGVGGGTTSTAASQLTVRRCRRGRPSSLDSADPATTPKPSATSATTTASVRVTTRLHHSTARSSNRQRPVGEQLARPAWFGRAFATNES
jgi:hypothetical protein